MEFDATFIIALISFICFVFIMNKIFYAPILKIMNDRQVFVENNYKESETIRVQTDKNEGYYDDELSKARDIARGEISKQAKNLKNKKSEIIADYKNQLANDVAKQKEELKNSAIEARDVLKNNVVDIAKNITHKIFGNDINVDGIDFNKDE